MCVSSTHIAFWPCFNCALCALLSQLWLSKNGMYCGYTVSRKGSAMVLLNKVLATSYTTWL